MSPASALAATSLAGCGDSGSLHPALQRARRASEARQAAAADWGERSPATREMDSWRRTNVQQRSVSPTEAEGSSLQMSQLEAQVLDIQAPAAACPEPPAPQHPTPQHPPPLSGGPAAPAHSVAADGPLPAEPGLRPGWWRNASALPEGLPPALPEGLPPGMPPE